MGAVWYNNKSSCDLQEQISRILEAQEVRINLCDFNEG